MTLPTIAFIGTGVMGSSMAGHLMDAGYPLVVFNRTRTRAEPLVERGATWADSAGEAAAHADVVVTMVGYPADVVDVYFADGGVIERAKRTALLIDMTTSSPALARKIADAASAAGLAALDAPVSGGDVGRATPRSRSWWAATRTPTGGPNRSWASWART